MYCIQFPKLKKAMSFKPVGCLSLPSVFWQVDTDQWEHFDNHAEAFIEGDTYIQKALLMNQQHEMTRRCTDARPESPIFRLDEMVQSMYSLCKAVLTNLENDVARDDHDWQQG